MIDGRWLFEDTTHLTIAGSYFAVERARPALELFLSGRRPSGGRIQQPE